MRGFCLFIFAVGAVSLAIAFSIICPEFGWGGSFGLLGLLVGGLICSILALVCKANADTNEIAVLLLLIFTAASGSLDIFFIVKLITGLTYSQAIWSLHLLFLGFTLSGIGIAGVLKD